MHSLLFLHDTQVNNETDYHGYSKVLVFDLQLKLHLESFGHRNVLLVSELECDFETSKSIFEDLRADMNKHVKLKGRKWEGIIDEISLGDLFDFQLKNAIGFQINLYVTLKKYLSKNNFRSVTTNIKEENWYSVLLKNICSELNLSYSFLEGVKLINVEDSHLEFSTTQNVGSSHRPASLKILFESMFNRTFLHSILRFSQRVYIRSIFLRMLFFILLYISNVVKDTFVLKSKDAVIVCYDKWVSSLIKKDFTDTLIVFHLITPPISREFFKYFLSRKYRFSYSFVSIFDRTASLETPTNWIAFHETAVDAIQRKLANEGSLLLESYRAIESLTKRYNVKALLTSYDSPPLHRATVVAAKACSVPTILNLHGLVSPPQFNLEAQYCEHIISWSNLVRPYTVKDTCSVINYKNPFHLFKTNIKTLENKHTYNVLVVTSNSPIDICTCFLNEAESRFLKFLKAVHNNAETLGTWNFTVKIHPSENIHIYQRIQAGFGTNSINIVNQLHDDDYAIYDFGICISPTTFMFEFLSRGLPCFLYDRDFHGISYYKNYLFSGFPIKESIITDFESFLTSKAFLTAQVQLEQEELRKLSKGSGPGLKLEDIVSLTMKERLCKE